MSHEDKVYENDCDKCREYNREFHNQDMVVFLEKNREMIREEFQTRQDVITDLDLIKKDIKWMKPALAVLAASIIIIFYILL